MISSAVSWLLSSLIAFLTQKIGVFLKLGIVLNQNYSKSAFLPRGLSIPEGELLVALLVSSRLLSFVGGHGTVITAPR